MPAAGESVHSAAGICHLGIGKLEFGTEQKRGVPSQNQNPMPTIICSLAALAVAGLFYAWRAYYQVRLQRLRERVAYMLWVMADNVA